MINSFIDTNVLVYLISSDQSKAKITDNIVEQGGIISVQVLNELSNIAHRKMKCSWDEVNEILSVIRCFLEVRPVTIETHEQGITIAKKYGFSLYDSMVVSAALLADCTALYSEDMQDRQLIDKRLRIHNPFSK